MNPISSAFYYAYEASPIFLTGGIVNSMIDQAGGVTESASAFNLFGTSVNWVQGVSNLGIPIVAITETLTVLGNIDIPAQPLFTFRPLPGGSIWKSEVAEMPFFTNQIAAVSQVQQPLNISLVSYCPANKDTTFALKLATFEALRWVIQQHVNNGGTFTVATPSYLYTDCLLTNIVDISDGTSNQSQVAWQWDFVQPLLTFPDLTSQLNKIIGSVSSGITNLVK